MIFRWLTQRRRAVTLAVPFPGGWDHWIRTNVINESHLTVEQKRRLRRVVQVFVAEKNWEGCGGLTVTDEMKVTIAAQVGLLVAGLEQENYFDHVLSILVYPTAYVAAGTQISRAGMILDGDQPRLGEAWWRGPVILSWADVKAGGRLETPGHNLVLHEFAHQLDMMNGRTTDGMPTVETRADVQRWVSVLGPAFDQLVTDCRQGRRGFIDCYGATNPAEFFAVITETFFERPHAFFSENEEAYAVLRDYYRLDPVLWQRRPFQGAASD